METLRKFADAETVAYLILKKFKVVSYVVQDGQVVFEFEDSPELERAYLDYLNNKARVEPQDYFGQVRCVLSFIFYALKEVK